LHNGLGACEQLCRDLILAIKLDVVAPAAHGQVHVEQEEQQRTEKRSHWSKNDAKDAELGPLPKAQLVCVADKGVMQRFWESEVAQVLHLQTIICALRALLVLLVLLVLCG
tara:strand:+ start:269 stop:601 length:333 start_codon:yes stop_codon:yes gene_type:complete